MNFILFLAVADFCLAVADFIILNLWIGYKRNQDMIKHPEKEKELIKYWTEK